MHPSLSLARVAVGLVGIWLGGLASSCGGDSDATAIPEGCEEALVKRSGGAPKCLPQAQCDDVRAHPDKVVSFYFNLFKMSAGQGESYPMAKRLHNRKCVADFLRARGVTRQEVDNGLNDVAVSASYKQAQAAFELAVVNDIELGCRTDDVCTQCAALSGAECQQEPFCAPRSSEVDPSGQVCDSYGRTFPTGGR